MNSKVYFRHNLNTQQINTALLMFNVPIASSSRFLSALQISYLTIKKNTWSVKSGFVFITVSPLVRLCVRLPFSVIFFFSGIPGNITKNKKGKKIISALWIPVPKYVRYKMYLFRFQNLFGMLEKKNHIKSKAYLPDVSRHLLAQIRFGILTKKLHLYGKLTKVCRTGMARTNCSKVKVKVVFTL